MWKVLVRRTNFRDEFILRSCLKGALNSNVAFDRLLSRDQSEDPFKFQLTIC